MKVQKRTKETKSSEWYTSAKYIEAARSVMGEIDLDPASCNVADQTVKATAYYTKEQNGLALPWYGRVWLNPPYGRTVKMQEQGKSTIYLFVKRLIDSYECGDVEQAILLVTTEVNAKWFYPLWQYTICFPDHRVHFFVPNETLQKYSQMFGTCSVYLGPNEARFTEVFSRFGRIVKAIDTPAPKPVTRELWTEVAV